MFDTEGDMQTFRSTFASLATDERSSYIKPTETPGPGQYQHPEYTGTGLYTTIKGTFPKSKGEGAFYSPGPGEYSVRHGHTQKSTPQYSMGGKYPEPRREHLPGPGNYDSNRE